MGQLGNTIETSPTVARLRAELEPLKVAAFVQMVTRSPATTDTPLNSVKEGRTHIEYTFEGGITRDYGAATSERAKAIVSSLISEPIEERKSLEVFSELRELARNFEVKILDGSIGPGFCRIVIEDAFLNVANGSLGEFEGKVEELFQGQFIEFVIREPIEHELQGRSEQGGAILHDPKLKTAIGVSELEHFRRNLQRLVEGASPGSFVSVEDGSLVIETPKGPRADWLKSFLPERVKRYPTKVYLREYSGDLESLSNDDIIRLVEVAVGQDSFIRLEKGIIEVHPLEEGNFKVSNINSALGRLLHSDLRVTIVPANDSWRKVSKDLPGEISYVYGRNVDSTGVVITKGNSASRVDEVGPDNLITNWDLPRLDLGVKLISVDPKGSAADLAFGIKEHTSGGFSVYGAMVNVARINPIGGDCDELIAQRGVSTSYKDLYPTKVRKTYIGLSTERERPLIVCTMRLDCDFNIVSISVEERKGCIDFSITPESFKSSQDPFLNVQRCLHEKVARGLLERAKISGRLSFPGVIYDPIVQELHLLLYSALGEWFTQDTGRRSIAVPYRASEKISKAANWTKVSQILGVELSPKLLSEDELQVALAEKLENLPKEKLNEIFSLLRVGAFFSTDSRMGHPLLGYRHYLRAGASIWDDLGRVVQHQMMAALGSAIPLGKSEVERRIGLHQRALGDLERVRANPIIYQLPTIISELGEVVQVDLIGNQPIRGRFAQGNYRGHSVRVTGEGMSPGQKIQCRISGYSLVEGHYIGEAVS